MEIKPGQKVSQIRAIAGVQLGAKVIMSLVADKETKMELHPAGVLVEMKGKRILVPYSNLNFVGLDA